jgi:hypothetical protein
MVYLHPKFHMPSSTVVVLVTAKLPFHFKFQILVHALMHVSCFHYKKSHLTTKHLSGTHYIDSTLQQPNFIKVLILTDYISRTLA